MIEIYCKKNLKLNGIFTYREAARGIIIEDNKILLVFSEKFKDYKLPGGGLEKNENFEQALLREVREETGFSVEIESFFEETIEFDEGQEVGVDYFKMYSQYFICKRLEKNSQIISEIGSKTMWVSIDDAIFENKKAILKSNSPWVRRELEMFFIIKNKLFKSLLSDLNI
ncbi:MAG: NUDIX domain-containing protein [Fusobacteriaceae bacterium]|nr:NUDIX domain-containing protein [Fusobacteriaceae bacterium]